MASDEASGHAPRKSLMQRIRSKASGDDSDSDDEYAGYADGAEGIAFTTKSDSTVGHEGWLWKTNSQGKNWKRRFVVVDATTGTLRYYKNHPTITFAKYKVTEHPKGVISLEGSTATEATSTHLKSMRECSAGFVLATPGRTTIFAVEESKEVSLWMDAIIRVTHAYAEIKASTGNQTGKKPLYIEPVQPSKLTGVLRKTSPSQATWTERLCVLDANMKCIIYYSGTHPLDKDCKGFVDLRAADLLAGVSEERGALSELPGFRLRVVSGGDIRIFGFCAPTKDAAQVWINYIATAMSLGALDNPMVGGSHKAPMRAGGSVKIEQSPPKPTYTTLESVFKTGWLKKCNTSLSSWSWRSRFFKLIGNRRLLSYASGESDKIKGSLELNDAILHVGSPVVKTPTPFVFSVDTPERIFYMCADSLETLRGWVYALEAACGLS